jgi:membrane protein
MPSTIANKKLPGKRRRWRRVRQVLEESLVGFFNEDSLMVSGSIAYHSLLSIFPFLLLLTGLGGLYIRHFELAGRLAIVLDRYLPMKPDFIMQNLESISRSYGRIGLISVLILLWSSAGVFMPLEKALNRAWEVQAERSWWGKHLLALEMALVIGFLLMTSTALVGVNVYIHNWLRNWQFPLPAPLIGLAYHTGLIATTFTVTLMMFVVLFARLPNRPMQLRQVFPSALVTAILWEGARSLFTLLLPRFNYRHVYGSIGVVVALMTWAYISSALVLFGAQVSSTLYGTLESPLTDVNGPAAPQAHGAEGTP